MDHVVSALHRGCAGSWCLTAALVVICAAGATAEQVTVDCSPGNPSGSQFTSISAAVSHLNTLPALGDWDSILLRSDCTDNVYLTRSRIWITPEFDCPWNGCPNTPYRITAANPAQPVVSVEGPHDITLVHLILSGGVNGLTIANGGSVIADGVVAEKSGLNESVSITNGNGFVVDVGSYLSMGEGGAVNNAGYGVVMAQGASGSFFGNQSWLQGTPLVISGNGRGGIRADRAQFGSWAGVTIENNNGWGLILLGADTSFGAAGGVETVVRNNSSGGAFVSEGSEASFWGRTTFQKNGPYGIYLDGASGAVFVSTDGTSVVIESHAEVGVNVTTHSHASFRGPHVVRGNGAAMKAWSAGVRVDGGSHAYFSRGPVGMPAEVSDNIGAGILLDLGSVLDAPSAIIDGNSQQAVRVAHRSTAYLGQGTQLELNAGGPLSCDLTSLVVTSRVPRSLACPTVERATEPRPQHPEPSLQ